MVGIAQTIRRAVKRIRMANPGIGPASAADRGRPMLTVSQALEQNTYKKSPARADRIFEHFWDYVEQAGIASGHVVEIGGRKNPIGQRLDRTRFTYNDFDIAQTTKESIVADITDCPQIPDHFCDIVMSVDVFEHIKRPWLAAKEISRILKPGGIVYTSTLFSWRYHPCPIDYWRFSPDCLTFLFEDLTTIASDFDVTERRRNMLGRGRSQLRQDAFGGWRENWRVFHVGRKDSAQ